MTTSAKREKRDSMITLPAEEKIVCPLVGRTHTATTARSWPRQGGQRSTGRTIAASTMALLACLLLALPTTATARSSRVRLASTGPLAVLVSRPCKGCGPGGSFGYVVALVDETGHVVAHASAMPAPGLRVGAGLGSGLATPLPLVSVSRSRVYFLDGAAQVNSLAASGAVAPVTSLPGDATTRVAFAVSPDDRQMAVSLLLYKNCQTPQPGMGLACRSAQSLVYTADVHGAWRRDFFSSTTVAEWPVAWHGTSVVLGVGDFGTRQAAPNPAGTFAGYHVADPATGLRQAALCTAQGDMALGPLTPAGTVCLHIGRTVELTVVSPTGAERSVAILSQPTYAAALAPDGTRIAYMASPAGTLVVRQVGAARVVSASLTGAPLGFLDATHLLVNTGVGLPAYRLLDVTSGALRPLQGLPRAVSTSILSFAGTVAAAS